MTVKQIAPLWECKQAIQPGLITLKAAEELQRQEQLQTWHKKEMFSKRVVEWLKADVPV